MTEWLIEWTDGVANYQFGRKKIRTVMQQKLKKAEFALKGNMKQMILRHKINASKYGG